MGLVVGALVFWPDRFETDGTFLIMTLFLMTIGAIHGLVVGIVYGAIIGVITGALVRMIGWLPDKFSTHERMMTGIASGAIIGGFFIVKFGEIVNLLYGVFGSAVVGALMGVPVGAMIAIISILQHKSRIRPVA